MTESNQFAARRAFLRYLAASPVVAGAGRVMGQPALDIFDVYAPQLIERAQDAINVFDFHEAAKQSMTPGH